MEPEVFACSPKLLRGSHGEQCFEEARGKIWFQVRLTSPFDNVNSILGSVPSRSELPMEALLMQRYAQKLMTGNGEEHMSTVWDDPFVSAEVYILIKCLMGEIADTTKGELLSIREESNSSLEYVCHGRRRKAICFENPPLNFDGEGDENSCGNEEAGYNLSKRALLENRRSELSELPTLERMPLKREDRHLIDVSNYFLEQSLCPNEAPSTSATTSPTVVTQLFSPGQVRELLLKQPSFSQTIKERETDEGVNPWCFKFSKVFWTKVAPRVVDWSSYFVVRSASPSKSIFQFGQQRYAVQCRLGSGTYGIVYLVRLLPPLDANSDAATALMDTTTVGCLPEQQQRISNNGALAGILRVVKVEKPDFPLEFYYMRETRRRVVSAFRSGRIAIDVRPSICPALALTHSVGHFTCLLMPFYSVGLLNLLNYGLLPRQLISSKKIKNGRALQSSLRPSLRRSLSPSSPPSLLRYEEELVALYLSLELLWIAEGLHNHARIIHGDIKPDNLRINDRFPLLDVSVLDETVTNAGTEEEGMAGDDFTGCLMSGRCTKVLVLLDFGLCIDMARFPPDTAFKVEKKRSFPCIEMLTGRPWTYQLDLFNIAGVIYTLVFKRYMEVECFNGEWRPKALPRSNRVYRAIEVWRSIFSALLNVRSCASTDYPDLAGLRALCEAFLRDNAADYNVAAEKANAIIAHLSPGFNG